MARVAIIPQHLNDRYHSPCLCGDADHDGQVEIYGVDYRPGDHPVSGFERVWANQYARIPLDVQVNRLLSGIGDGDNDSLVELLVVNNELGNDSVSIVESPDSRSYPSITVWKCGIPPSDLAIPFGYTDLDRDGRPEIAVGRAWYGAPPDGGIVLYENTGDNRYDSVAFLSCPYVQHYTFRCMDTGDFDRDGLCELAAGTNWFVYVFEATGGDNQYALSAVCTLAVDTDFVYYLSSANDMDLDGRPEYVLMSYPGYDYIKLAVYESGSHAKYRQVWQRLVQGPPLFSDIGMSVGDVDGDSTNEFAYSVQGFTEIFKCCGPDQYEPVWSIDSGTGLCRLFDVNRNGRAELILDEGRDSLHAHCNIYEDTAGLSVAAPPEFEQKRTAAAAASIVSLNVMAAFTGLPPDVAIEIHGIDGRLVSRASGVRQSSWTWDLRNQAGNLVPAGTYFAVVRSKGKSTSLKLCVVK